MANVEPDVVGSGTSRQFKLLVLLGTLTTTISFIDRSVLNILAEPIKKDLHFSDTQLGLLTGFAFALFYSLAGLPIARYVDRPTTSRPAVIAACIALWSAMTVASGMALSYAQLVVARVLVAAGESGPGPATMTLLDHHVPSSMRSRVFGIYGLGVPLGSLLGLVLGGWLADLFGWRTAFIIVGAPGLLLAICVWRFMYEPRKDVQRSDFAKARQPSLIENILVIRHSPALLWLTAAVSTGGLFAGGLPSWTGVYLIRVLELSPTRAGLILGLITGIGGGLGSYFGGVIADRLSARDPGRALLVPCAGLLISIPAAVGAFLSHDWRVFAALYWISVLGAATYFGPVFALLQRLVSQGYRATTTVIVIMLANVIGAGLGPFLVGVASDLLNPQFGTESLRYVLIGGYATAVAPALFYLKAGSLADGAIRSLVAKERS